MQIWYLSPFLLALLVWWVATRRHPEDKEKWMWIALGVCSGAVLMFALVFFSEQEPSDNLNAASDTTVPASPDDQSKTTLENDMAMEILPPVRIREGRTIVAGSLQITLIEVTPPAARIQVEPLDEIDLLSNRQWTYTYGAETSDTPVTRSAVEVTLGEYVDFGFRGNIYRLSLLEFPRPLLGFVPENVEDLFAKHAVIRVIDCGAYTVFYGGPDSGGGVLIDDPDAGDTGDEPDPSN